jgi:hypothetical protein
MSRPIIWFDILRGLNDRSSRLQQRWVHTSNWSMLKYLKQSEDVRFEVSTAVTMKNAVFWDVAPCSSCVNQRFGGTYLLHLQGRKIRNDLLTLVPRSWIFYSENRGHTFFRNVGSHKNYTAPHPRRRRYSQSEDVYKNTVFSYWPLCYPYVRSVLNGNLPLIHQ